VTAKSLQRNSEKYWQQGKLSAPSTSVRPACEGLLPNMYVKEERRRRIGVERAAALVLITSAL
jgi:hypothetical protein